MHKTSSRLAPLALATAAAFAAPAAWSAEAQVIVRDTGTGTLRAATAAEAAALQATTVNNRRAAPERTLPKHHASGATGARLTSEFLSFAVVTRRADGTLAETCVHSAAEAESAVKTAATTKSAARLETE